MATRCAANGGSRWLPVRRPTPYVAEVFATLAAAHGLTLPRAEIMSQPPADAVEIVAHEGEDLTAVLADMLRFSTNLTAEAVADITSTGETLRANHLKILSDALILQSQAELFLSHQADWDAATRATLTDLLTRLALPEPAL